MHLRLEGEAFQKGLSDLDPCSPKVIHGNIPVALKTWLWLLNHHRALGNCCPSPTSPCLWEAPKCLHTWDFSHGRLSCSPFPASAPAARSQLVGSSCPVVWLGLCCLDLGLSTKSFPSSQVRLNWVILCDSACSSNVVKSHGMAKFIVEEQGNPSSFHKPGAPAFPTSRWLRDEVCNQGHSEVRSYQKKKKSLGGKAGQQPLFGGWSGP